jgi:hypothetical protein
MTSRRLTALASAWLMAMLLLAAPATADHMNGRYVGAGPAQGLTLDLQQQGYQIAGMLHGQGGQAQIAGQTDGGNNATGMMQMQTGQMAYFQLLWDQGGIAFRIVPAGPDGQPSFATAEQPFYLQRAAVGQMPQQPPQQQPWPQQPPQQQPWPQQPPQQQPWPQQPPQQFPQQPWPQQPQQQPWPPQQPPAQVWPAPDQPQPPAFPQQPQPPAFPEQPPQAMDPAPEPPPQAAEPALRFPDHPDMDADMDAGMDDEPAGPYDEPAVPDQGALPGEPGGEDAEDVAP